MGRSVIFLLFAVLLLPACRATRSVASGTANVVTAPARIVGRRLHRDDQTGEVVEDRVYEAPPVARNYPPPPPASRATPTPRTRTVVTAPNLAPSPARTSTPKPSPIAATSSHAATADFPVAKPVPGKPGYVFSPFDPAGGYVDVNGYQSGAKVRDPYSQKIFLVP